MPRYYAEKTTPYSRSVWYRREAVDAKLVETTEEGLREFLDWAGSGAMEVFGIPAVVTSVGPVLVTSGKWVVREGERFAIYTPAEMRRAFVREDSPAS